MLEVVDEGKGNRLRIVDDGRLNGRLLLKGSNNVVSIGAKCVSGNVQIECGNDAVIEIGEGCRLSTLFVYALRKSRVSIGPRCAFNGRTRLLLHESGAINVGEGCLFASAVDVSISDMHSILDAATGRRINPARDIKIGDRVWVGERALIFKGVEIGSDSIIGAGSIVTKSLPANCIGAGNPARVVKTGVMWKQELV